MTNKICAVGSPHSPPLDYVACLGSLAPEWARCTLVLVTVMRMMYATALIVTAMRMSPRARLHRQAKPCEQCT